MTVRRWNQGPEAAPAPNQDRGSEAMGSRGGWQGGQGPGAATGTADTSPESLWAKILHTSGGVSLEVGCMSFLSPC